MPTFRSREENPQTRDALDDCLAVVDYVKKMPVVDPKSVAVLGGSGGGSLALELAGETDLCAIVAGEPASVLFTGLMVRGMSDRGPAFQDVMRNPKKHYTPELQKFTRAKDRADPLPRADRPRRYPSAENHQSGDHRSGAEGRQ